MIDKNAVRILSKAIIAGIKSNYNKDHSGDAIEKLVTELNDCAMALDMETEGKPDRLALSQVDLITMFTDMIEDNS